MKISTLKIFLQHAATYLALQAHLQVSQWKQIDLKCLNQIDMHWKRTDGCLKPIKTELNVAPDFIMNVVPCKRPLGTHVGQRHVHAKRMA